MFADLHLHSTYSDGTNTPLELCQMAQEHKVKVISITDHDTVGGQKALLDMQTPQDIEIITGIEISMLQNHRMHHILGYYIDIHAKTLDRFLEDLSADVTESTRLNFEKARADGTFLYEWERVLELNAGQPRIGGSRVVKAMRIDGYEVPGMGLDDMYRKYFLCENTDYIWCSAYTAYDAIDIIKAIGGVPVVAHPKSIGDDDTVLDLIRYGVQGLEVYHPSHSSEDVAKYLQMAADKKLYVTGGSDWHGKSRNNANHLGRAFAATGLANKNYEILKRL